MDGGLRLQHFQFVRSLIFTSVVFLCGSAQAQDYVPGEVIIKLKGKASSVAASQFLNKMQSKMAHKASFHSMNLHRFSLKGGQSVESAVAELNADPAVQYAEPNFILRKAEDSLQSSAVFSEQDLQAQQDFQAQAGCGTYTQSCADVHVDQAWTQIVDLTNNTEKPIVAVIDSGVYYNHKIFQQSNAMWRNPGEISGNGIDDDGNGYVDDIYGYDFRNNDADPVDDDEHGTHVAGIVLGVGQDVFETTLSTSRVRIMALKFLGADGTGTTSGAIAAVYYAVRNGAQVINNSWGGSSYSQSLHDALTYAYNNHVFIASAAGNYSKNNDQNAMYPANYPVPSQISVGATNDWDSYASFSNYGVSSVHVAAPGVSILSSVPPTTSSPGNANFRFMSGTSMATPFVAGLAALIIREAPDLSGYQIKNLIQNTVTTFSGLASRVSTGGRVDVYDSIMAAKSEVTTQASQPAYVAEYRGLASEGESSSSEGGAKGCGTVSSGLLGGGGNSPMPPLGVLFALSALPLIVWYVVRGFAKPQTKRRFERFAMDSSVKLNVGGRELVGHMKTISEGGLSFEADTLLEKGGIVTMQIQSPDGNEMVQVQGHIVWCEKNKAYGVQFDEAKESALSLIRQWSRMLVRV